jgi:hypothetical protein
LLEVEIVAVLPAKASKASKPATKGAKKSGRGRKKVTARKRR